ncbi:MAG: 1-deoxy-D-xylulose-5-phosphate reductoisomerase [Magnetococcales bacterium]|nr:1-deoxy-D-xylulose-5-phosphate reductoisomerase [Magnetococcales bacterium]
MSVKNLALLGSTGSIGQSTLDVVAAHPDRFKVVAMAAGGNSRRAIVQALRFRPELLAMGSEESAREVRRELPSLEVLSGPEGLLAVARHGRADMVVSALVGAVGLAPTMAAIRAGKDIALANKECLVMAGALFMSAVAEFGVRLLPVDSEHSAIFQVLNGREALQNLILTASGGPFRGWSRERLEQVTPEMALAHPTWNMGPKITIDSASMMNKGLEVIEARWLFDVEASRIKVVVHPESIVHSMVQYADGSVLAQLGVPDMRTPIAVALAWPERIAAPVKALDLVALGRLHFEEAPGGDRFPCLPLAYAALCGGGRLPAVLNAANEVAVAAFLAGKIPFLGIPAAVERAMSSLDGPGPGSLEELLALDLETREFTSRWIGGDGRRSLQ